MTVRRGWLIDAGVIATTLGLAYLLKRFYSQAGFDDLLWVLAPTTWLVELLSGSSFELEAHRAYLSRHLLFEIVPSCAGLNFLIVTFCSLGCGLVHTRRTTRSKLGHLLVSGVVAYLATLLANATRIWIGIQLHVSGLSLGPLTPDRLHRIEGIAVYFLFLLANTEGGRSIPPKRGQFHSRVRSDRRVVFLVPGLDGRRATGERRCRPDGILGTRVDHADRDGRSLRGSRLEKIKESASSAAGACAPVPS